MKRLGMNAVRILFAVMITLAMAGASVGAGAEEMSDIAVMRHILDAIARDHMTEEDMEMLGGEIGLKVKSDTEVAGTLPEKDHMISYEWVNDRFILLIRQLKDGSIRAINILIIGQEIVCGEETLQTNEDMLAFLCDYLDQLEQREGNSKKTAGADPTKYRVWRFGQGQVYIASDENGSPYHHGEIWLYGQY